MDGASGAQVRLNSLLLPALVVVLLVLQLVVPFRGWAILLVGLGGTWLISYYWARSLARGLALKREIRFGWAHVGDRLEERYTLENGGWAPALWVEVVDHSTMPDYRVGRVSGVAPQGTMRWQTSGLCTRRGLFTLGPTTLRSGDPFGLYTVTVEHPSSSTVMVTPPVVPLPSIEVASGGHAGDGRPRPHAAARSFNTAGAREYVPGDNPRWIHWPLSAHTDTLFVRLFDGAPVGDWWIFLDIEAGAQVGEGGKSTEEHGVILAASLADVGLRAGRDVGLVSQGQDLLWLPPRGGEEQRLAILRSLALLEQGERPLVELLERARPSIGRYASLVLITPAVDPTWIAPLLPLMRRGAVPTVLLLDPVSFGGTATTAAAQRVLDDLGIAHYTIGRDLLDRPEAQPGQQGLWEWRVLATGRVIPTQQPKDRAWRELA
jgi:uncharacterized protein (DUF58 family)